MWLVQQQVQRVVIVQVAVAPVDAPLYHQKVRRATCNNDEKRVHEIQVIRQKVLLRRTAFSQKQDTRAASEHSGCFEPVLPGIKLRPRPL